MLQPKIKAAYTELLQKKSHEIDAYLELTEKQEAFIQQEDTDNLDANLQMRERTMQRLVEIQKQLDALRKNGAPEQADAIAQDADIQAIVASCDERIRKAVALDEQNSKRIEEKMADFKQRIRKQQTNKQGMTAYLQAGDGYSSFDQKR